MDRLLIHSCRYGVPTGRDRDGNEVVTEQTLEKVRIVPVLATQKDSMGESKNDKLTLYYKPGTSTPNIVPSELATVTWGGNKYKVREVRSCYTKDNATVHHYEAALE